MTASCPLKSPTKPIVIGHRGTSFHVPEHTLAGYRLALELSADYIEPDLVPTKDLVLIAMHDIDLSATTDVHEKFPDRFRMNVTHNGVKRSGYFPHDFTLSEIKQLRVKQRIADTPSRNPYFNWLFTIPTLNEIIDLLYHWNTDVLPFIYRKSPFPKAGMYAELKQPKWIYEDAGIDVGNLFVETLRAHPKSLELFFNGDCLQKQQPFTVPPLVLQCFEIDTLIQLRTNFIDDDYFQGVVPPNVYLISTKHCFETDLFSHKIDPNLSFIDGIGPDKACIFKQEPNATYPGFVNFASQRSLVVHPWTEQMEVEFVEERFNDAIKEVYYLFCKAGVDGIFAENVDLAVLASIYSCDRADLLLGTPRNAMVALSDFMFEVPFWVGAMLSAFISLVFLMLQRRKNKVASIHRYVEPIDTELTVRKWT